ncbi:MAG: primosomal protein N', partial [Magnetospirillum sp. WYHS-4]
MSIHPQDRVSILLPLPLHGPFDYRVPKGLAVAPGDFVSVPFGGREAIGVVWGDALGGLAEERLKWVSGRLDAVPLPPESRKFVDWVAHYTLQPQGAVLKMAMSVSEALEPPRPHAAYALAEVPPADLKPTPARLRVLEALRHGPPRTLADLAR